MTISRASQTWIQPGSPVFDFISSHAQHHCAGSISAKWRYLLSHHFYMFNYDYEGSCAQKTSSRQVLGFTLRASKRLRKLSIMAHTCYPRSWGVEAGQSPWGQPRLYETCLQKGEKGFWRVGSVIKSTFCSCRTQVQFPAPTKWLTTACNSSSIGSITLLWRL